MLFRYVIALHFEKRMKRRNAACGKIKTFVMSNHEFLAVITVV